MERGKTTKDPIKEDNCRVFALLSRYLNNNPGLITREDIVETVKSGVSGEYAFAVLLAAGLGLDLVDNAADRELFNLYFVKMVHQLDPSAYCNNPYYKNISIQSVKIGNCELKFEKYRPFEGFVCNDIIRTEEGRQIPPIGFFENEFIFPAVLENDRIWISITPNEIETMKEVIDQAFGRVLTFGLGMGYYAYMVSQKENVENITVVENNEDVIEIFTEYILPQFKNAHKIHIIKAEAFEYARNHMSGRKYDFVFVDLWHDVSDGIDMYLRMKEYEKQSPDTMFSYWIEKSILCYL